MRVFAGGQSSQFDITEQKIVIKLKLLKLSNVQTKNRRGEKLENHRKTSQAIGGGNAMN